MTKTKMSCIYNLRQKEEKSGVTDGVTCNILPVHIDYTGYVSSGSSDWNKGVERAIMTDEVRKGWHGVLEEDLAGEIKDNKGNVSALKEEVLSGANSSIQTKDNVNVAYLRGRRLLGREYNIKEKYNYDVTVFKEKDDGIGGISDDKVYDVIGKGDKLVNYGHDDLPELGRDSAKKLQEWIDLSIAIHGN